MDRSAQAKDLVAALVLLGVAGLAAIGARDVAPPIFEPLGAAFVPNALAAILAVLALTLGVRALRAGVAPAETADPAQSWARALGGVGATLAFVAILATGAVGYVPLTTAYVFGLGALLLESRSKAQLAWLAVFAVTLAASTYLVFTRLLYVRLP